MFDFGIENFGKPDFFALQINPTSEIRLPKLKNPYLLLTFSASNYLYL